MSPRESVYQFTQRETGMTFFATEINAKNIISQLESDYEKDWEKEYIYHEVRHLTVDSQKSV